MSRARTRIGRSPNDDEGGKNRRATRLACTRAYRLLTRNIASREETIDTVVIEFRKEKFQTRIRERDGSFANNVIQRIFSFFLSSSLDTNDTNTRRIRNEYAYVGKFLRETNKFRRLTILEYRRLSSIVANDKSARNR